jgi:aspartate/methionine/tyrosine aminotransferase
LDKIIVTISSLSKAYGLPQLRRGWVTADRRMLPQLSENSVLYQNIGCKLMEVLGAMAFERLVDFREAAHRVIAENRELMSEWLANMSARGLLEECPLGHGCLVFPRLIGLPSAEDLAEQLESRFGVLVAPGTFFGGNYHDRIRIGFGGDGAILGRGLSRLAEGLTALRKGI